MIRKYVLSLLALAGVVFAMYTVRAGNQPSPIAQPVVPPAQTPFDSHVAGTGIVEASTRNIEIGTPVSGVVTQVLIEAGDQVEAGQPLLRLDDREMTALLAVRQAALDAAMAQLQKLAEYPRPEDVPPAEARVRAAEKGLADLKNQLKMWESVTDRRAVTQEELDRRRFAVEVATAQTEEANAELALLRAGSWKPDIDIAKAQVASAQAQVNQIRTEIDRLTIAAPIAGQILQLNIRVGEFAMAGVLQSSLVLMGDVNDLHVRVDVDENDAWRVKPGAKAVAFLRGNPRFKTDLTFVRFEPYVVPKQSLTGAGNERVDTRVLQVLYRFKREALPVFVGQLMDVSIDALPIAGESDVVSVGVSADGAAR